MICISCGKKRSIGVKHTDINEYYCDRACARDYFNKILGSNLTEEDMDMVMEWGFKPEKNVDQGFEPFTGTYIGRIDTLERKQGTSEKTGKEYDFYTLKVQTVKRIKGDDVKKRFLDKIYNPDEEGVKALANDLFTAGIDVDVSSEEAFEGSFEKALDKFITVRAYKAKSWKKEGDEFIELKDEAGKSIPKQKWSIPSTQEDTKEVEAEDASSIPF